jgi:hypothetical protein
MLLCMLSIVISRTPSGQDYVTILSSEGLSISVPYTGIGFADNRPINPPKGPQKMNYPSLHKIGPQFALYNAWAESLHPRVAEIMLIQSTHDANNRVLKLCEAAKDDGIVVDEEIVLGRHKSVDVAMKERVAKHAKVYGYKLPEVPENEVLPISTDPADYKPFDLAGHIAGGGKGPRELWIEDPTQSGPLFSPGIDSTSYGKLIQMGMTPNGNPLQNYNQQTEYERDEQGFNGALVRTDSVFGFRVPFGEHVGPGESESGWRLLKEGQFERADKVNPDA